jgi:hypothetical protein
MYVVLRPAWYGLLKIQIIVSYNKWGIPKTYSNSYPQGEMGDTQLRHSHNV